MSDIKVREELKSYVEKDDCCFWIVELRKAVADKDKEIERLNNIINNIRKRVLDEGKPLASPSEIIYLIEGK